MLWFSANVFEHGLRRTSSQQLRAPTSRTSTPPPDKITAMKSCIMTSFVRLNVFVSRV
jgi:hypothetical protein